MFGDLKLLNLPVQRRGWNSEFRRGSIGPGNSSLAFSQGRFDDFFLLILEGLLQWAWSLCTAWRLAGQPSLFDPKCIAAAENHRSLDNILQFANVARPLISLAQLKRLFVNLTDLFSHL